MLKLSFELHGLSERIRFIEHHQQALNVSLQKFKMYLNIDNIFEFFIIIFFCISILRFLLTKVHKKI